VPKVNTDDLIGPEEVAALIGLTNVNGVSVYRKRHPDFPAPVVLKGRCVLWVRQDIEKWARGRRS
jgi:predicted DNA-binding transcriptional regulator AlpA